MQLLEFGKYYHVYNRGINSCNLFEETANYEHFLRLYEKYILPIEDTYAWCLMPNHPPVRQAGFHILVKIKEKEEIIISKLPNPVRVLDPDRISKKIQLPHIYFSHLFNSYTQAFNKRYNRTGSLFQRPFKRIHIENESYLKYLIYYIHHNPVNHGFVEDMIEYPWSSFLSILSPKETNLKRQQVIDWFDDLNNLKSFHQQEHNIDQIKHLI